MSERSERADVLLPVLRMNGDSSRMMFRVWYTLAEALSKKDLCRKGLGSSMLSTFSSSAVQESPEIGLLYPIHREERKNGACAVYMTGLQDQ